MNRNQHFMSWQVAQPPPASTLPPAPDSAWAISEKLEELRKANARPRISIAVSLGLGAALLVFAYVVVAIATGWIGPSVSQVPATGVSAANF
jgi:hypothetical protein